MVGLKAGGNNCFLNAVLQTLWHLDAFRELLLSRWMLPLERGWAAAQCELAISLASLLAPLLVKP